MRTVCKFVLVLGLSALLAAPALAQRQRQGQGRGGFGGGGLLMLRSEDFQKELKLTDEQKDKLKPILEDAGTKLREIFQGAAGNREEAAKKMQELNKDTMAKVNPILDDKQKKRMRQIMLQTEGIRAFADPEVQAALKLTDEQKTKLREIGADAAKQMADLRQGGGGNFEKMAELRKDSLNKANAVLTDDQKKSFKELTGEPFNFQFQRRRQQN
jgi:Spy/CpxP family protein refolding chaperone